jgi:Ca2+-binding RTX toxin-like protein
MKARLHAFGALALATIALMGVSSVVAEARVFVGSKKANKIRGTNKADTIRPGAGNDRVNGRGGADRIVGAAGRDQLSGAKGSDRLNGGSGSDKLLGGAGNDRASGGGGNDRLSGSAGRDRLRGGKGKDRLVGGAGNDYLDAADGRQDTRVDGGRGTNRCRIDAADLSVTTGCGTVTVAPGGGSGGGTGAPGGTGGAPGGTGLPGAPGGAGSPGTVSLLSASGLSCDALTPTCGFSLTLDPGSTPIGDLLAELQLEGNGGASLVGVSPLVQVGDNVVAGGVYACTEDGVLVLVFRDQRIEVPVACDRP